MYTRKNTPNKHLKIHPYMQESYYGWNFEMTSEVNKDVVYIWNNVHNIHVLTKAVSNVEC